MQNIFKKIKRGNFNFSKLQNLMIGVYLLLCIQFFFIFGLAFGLGIFGFLPALITAFQLIIPEYDAVKVIRINPIHFFWHNYFLNLKKYWLHSLLIFVVTFMLLNNIIFLEGQTSLFTLWLYYLTIIMLEIFCFMVVCFAYLSANYPKTSNKERIQNTLAYSLARLPEAIVFYVFLVAVLLVIYQIMTGLLVFCGIGLVIASHYYFFKFLTQGGSFSKLGHYWRAHD
ncbi:hypothetical protein [Facklamia miroungae]|uniref:Uncharacterized protein n=1 Tax=Facklamia miroungae TaxID=120956 RepID=A0A1G7QA06_9LACT|nr:hypothetical protein [Facklamia miroungae]NKZ28874.1 hypothetical protein [Facklamia miroungae]SDF95323.1 hypothetical protein SAMN05421791_10222 [Facklamia miroungae]